MEKIKYLKWDSHFFHKKIGEIKAVYSTSAKELKNIINMARKRCYCCLYLKIPALQLDIIRFCKRNDFSLVSYQTLMKKKTNSISNYFVDPRISTAPGRKFMPALEKIAVREIAEWSRFYKDPRFGIKVAKKLYRIWVGTYFKSRARGKIFTYVMQKKPVGFVLLKVKRPIASIDLIGVKKKKRNCFIGQKLLHACVSWASLNKIDEVQVVTDSHNRAAIKAFKRAGFRISEVNYVYHKWL